jgi:hypothetical protein
MQKFISARANGYASNDDEIVISFYGPRGGSRAIESLNLEAAEKLLAELARAIAELKRVEA